MDNHSTVSLTRFSFYEASNFQSDLNLITEIRNLITPSYNDVTTLLEREIAHNQLIYFTRDQDGKLASFFMTNIDIIDGKVYSYMGLLAVNNQYKCYNLTAPLIIRYLQNLRVKEREFQQQILSWATTATICSYKCLTSFCDDYQPREDGSYTANAKNAAATIARYYKLNYHNDNPFILKRVAVGTSYSYAEKERIRNIIQHKKFKLFENFGINEQEGDRVLLIGSRISDEKYNRWLLRLGMDTCAA